MSGADLSDLSAVDSDDAALEVVVMWGELSILHVAHLAPPRAFCVGDALDSHGKLATDFLIGSESLGIERLPIVVERDSRLALVIPHGATGTISFGDESVTFEELALQQQLRAAVDLPGAQLYPMQLGATARMEFQGFGFVVRQTSAARKIGSERRAFVQGDTWTLASLLVHAGVLLSFQFLPPHSSALSLDLLNADSRIVSYLNEPPETVDEPKPAWLEVTDDAVGGTGKRHEGDDGQAGKPDKPRADSKPALRKSDSSLTREQAQEVAKSAGIIGIMRASAGATIAPTSQFERDNAEGQDAETALSQLISDRINASTGFGGLTLRGTGRGGGGTGRGVIGVGNIGTRGIGSGHGSDAGYGNGAGRLVARVSRVPHIKTGAVDIHGSLSKEVIRRVIHQHISEVRYCYEQELNVRPDLQGRVSVKLVIAPTGAVQAAAVQSSELHNLKVEQCITQSVRRWIFPAPEGGGLVIVNYPFVLSQTGD